MTDDSPVISHALLSCTDKTGLDRLAAYLAKKGVKMVASGGTAKELRRLGHPCTDVSEWTQSPEILDGRVKTLHPRIHAALLAKRSSQVDMDCLRGMKLPQIDLVVVNLYGFEKSPAVENIDVGGPSMLRAAAKNFQWVTVLSNPSQYDAFMDACSGNGGRTTLAFRKDCAAQVFRLCSQFDEAVGDFLGGTLKEPKDRSASALTTLPPRLKLRYGENPQQGATLHYPSDPPYRVLQGKEISYNNLCDMQAAIQIAFGAKKYFGTEDVHCAVIKHQNPCGFGRGKSVLEAWQNALAGDPEAAFGGVVAFDQPLDRETSETMSQLFLEVIVAPSWSADAEAFTAKKNLRLVEWSGPRAEETQARSWFDGLLIQEADTFEPFSEWKTQTSAKPNSDQEEAARTAWYVCRYVKSNAVVAALPNRILAVGAGQMSRVDSVRILVRKLSEQKSTPFSAICVASDAFFPFKDALELLAKAGVRSVIQPGGSVRDDEVFQAAENLGVSVIVTGRRHFYH